MRARLRLERVLAADVGSPYAVSVLYEGDLDGGEFEVELVQPPIRFALADGRTVTGLTVACRPDEARVFGGRGCISSFLHDIPSINHTKGGNR